MIWASGVIGGLGLIAILSRKTLLGVLIGTQLLILGGALAFVLSGVASGGYLEGHLFGALITLSGVAQLVTGYAIATRLFYLRKRIMMDDVRNLKH